VAHAEASAKTVEAAIAAASTQLGLRSDQVEVEILEDAVPSTFGVIGSPARVRVTPRDPTPAGSTPAGESSTSGDFSPAGRSPLVGSGTTSVAVRASGGLGSATVAGAASTVPESSPAGAEAPTVPGSAAAGATASASGGSTATDREVSGDAGRSSAGTDASAGSAPAAGSAAPRTQPGGDTAMGTGSEAAAFTGSTPVGHDRSRPEPTTTAPGQASSGSPPANAAGQASTGSPPSTASEQSTAGVGVSSTGSTPTATTAPLDSESAPTGAVAPAGSTPVASSSPVSALTSAEDAAPAASAAPTTASRPGRPPKRDHRDEPITAEMVEADTERAGDFLEGLLDALDVDGDITTWIDEVGGHIDLEGSDLDDLVGPNGETLDALQELTRLAVLRQTKRRARLLLDVNGFRARQREQLVSDVKATVERVLQSREDHELRPMTPAERKIVHDAVAAIGGAQTESLGEEPNRRVVIRPT
jgi:spoIIIJ-associated protein